MTFYRIWKNSFSKYFSLKRSRTHRRGYSHDACVCVAKHRVLIYTYLSACLPTDHIATHSNYLCAKATLHHHLSKIPALWAFCAAVTLKPWDKLYFRFSTQTQPDWAKYTSQLICSCRQIIRKYHPYLSLSLILNQFARRFAAIQMTRFHACKMKLVLFFFAVYSLRAARRLQSYTSVLCKVKCIYSVSLFAGGQSCFCARRMGFCCRPV